MNVSRTRLVALAALLAALSPALSGAGQTDTRHVETLATLDIGSGGLTVGPDGTIYVADFGSRLGGGGTGGDRVLKVSPAGEVALFATGLKGASGNEMGLDGNLYQSNIGANLISQITRPGKCGSLPPRDSPHQWASPATLPATCTWSTVVTAASRG